VLLCRSPAGHWVDPRPKSGKCLGFGFVMELLTDDLIGSGGRDRTADLGVMKTISAAAYNAFQSINQHFPRRNSRLSRTQSTRAHIAHRRLQQVYNKHSSRRSLRGDDPRGVLIQRLSNSPSSFVIDLGSLFIYCAGYCQLNSRRNKISDSDKMNPPSSSG
jgi:hypothetical protein